MADHAHHNHDMGSMTTMNPMSSASTDNGMNSHHGHSGHSGMGMDMDMDMKMFFHSGVKAVILFDDWRIDSVGGLIGSMVGIFLMAMFYEGLKYYREYLFRKSYASVNFSCINTPGERPKSLPTSPISIRHRMLSSTHLLQTFLHVIQVTLSYFLMLIFMTYNVWLCISVVVGAAVGFFIFGWKKAIVVDITEHCH